MNELKNSNCVFVVAQGRSGSTLLLRLLNEIEGYNICGENYGAISKLCAFYQSIIDTMVEASKRIPKDDNSGFKKKDKFLTYEELLSLPNPNNSYSGFEWYNVYNIESVKEKLRELIFEIFNSQGKYSVWGFKEIRFGNATSYDVFRKELDFLKELFPHAKFIFNTRNLEKMLQSAWWAENKEKSRQILEKQSQFFEKYSANNPEFTYQLTYEDLINNSKNLNDMYQFLGEPFELEKYKAVLSR